MAEVASTAVTRKPGRPKGSRKVAASKPAVRKTSTRKSATSKRTTSKRAAPKAAARKPAITIDKVGDTVKEVAFVQLGICGKVYDEVNTRVSKARKDAPKQWSELVKRGERVQKDLEKAQKDLGKDLKKRVGKLDVRADLEGRVAKVRKAVTKLTKRVKKAA